MQRVGHLVERVAADDPREVDRRAVEEVGAQRLNGRVSMRRKASWALRIALSPSHGVEPCAAVPLTSTRTASTPLACTPMCRSVGSPVIAKSPRRPSSTSSSVERCVDVLGLLVGHADEAHAHLVLGGDVVERAHHRREAALHVVGAAADQPVALDARLELLGVRRARRRRGRGRSTRGPSAGPDLGHSTGSPPWSRVGDRHLARLQPALDEPGRGAEPIDLGRVVGDQALGQHAFVHALR